MGEKKKSIDLILTFPDIFTTQGEDSESCTLEHLQINLIEEMEISAPIPDAAFISPSKSSSTSQVMVARPEGRAPRLCIDHRGLKQITKGDSYPSLIENCPTIQIRKQNRHKTGFACTFRLFEWGAMPCGFKNAPACFQRVDDYLSNQVNASQVTKETESKDKGAQMRAYLYNATAGSHVLPEMIILLEKLLS